jgi:hypothetical protein
MFKCIISKDTHESVYDICENIYDNMCYCNTNIHQDKQTLKINIQNFIENYVNGMTIYETNNILIFYGIDNAVLSFAEKQKIKTIDLNTFSKSLIISIIIDSILIIYDK